MSSPFRLVVLGSLGMSVECLEWLLDQEAFEVLGVVCTRQPRSRWRQVTGDRDMQEEAPRLGVPLLELDDLCALRPDLALSCPFHAILRKRHLQSASIGVVNYHPAPLPEMRGSMGDAVAIAENRTEFGVTLHLIDEGVDTGDLLVVERFPIGPCDTVYDLFRRCQATGLKLIKEHLLDIATGRIKPVAQDEVCKARGIAPRTFRRRDVLRLKAVPAGLTPQQLWNRARAFEFPGHEPAYLETPAGRLYLKTTDLPITVATEPAAARPKAA